MGRPRGGGARLALAGALMLSGCAVGPDYVRPAAIVPVQYKEVKGWKLGIRRASRFSPRAIGGSCSTTRSSMRFEAQVTISNQTLKADEANYREGRSADRRGPRPAFSEPDLQPVADAHIGPEHDLELRDQWKLDDRSLGQSAPDDRKRGRRRASERGRPRQRAAFHAVLARDGLFRCCAARDGFFSTICWKTPSDSMRRSLDITQNQLYSGRVRHIGALRRHHRAGPGVDRGGAGAEHRGRARAI